MEFGRDNYLFKIFIGSKVNNKGPGIFIQLLSHFLVEGSAGTCALQPL